MRSHWDFTTTVSVPVSIPGDEREGPSFDICGDVSPSLELRQKIAELAPESTEELLLTINIRGSSDPGNICGPPDSWREPEIEEERILECIDCVDESGDLLQSITIPKIQAAGIEDELHQIIDGLDIDYPDSEYDDSGNDSYDDGEDDLFRIAL